MIECDRCHTISSTVANANVFLVASRAYSVVFCPWRLTFRGSVFWAGALFLGSGCCVTLVILALCSCRGLAVTFVCSPASFGRALSHSRFRLNGLMPPFFGPLLNCPGAKNRFRSAGSTPRLFLCASRRDPEFCFAPYVSYLQSVSTGIPGYERPI